MRTYRTKPVEIQAILFTEDNRQTISELSGCRHEVTGEDGLEYKTLHLFFDIPGGQAIASPGDWIIKDAGGAFIPMRADQFEEFYELVR